MNSFNLYKFSGIFKYFRHFKNLWRIPCVCPLIDHGSRPMKSHEFLRLYKTSCRFYTDTCIKVHSKAIILIPLLYHTRGGTLKNAYSASFVRFRPRDVITCLNLPAWRHYSASLLLTPPPHSSALPPPLLRPSSAPPPPFIRPSSAPPLPQKSGSNGPYITTGTFSPLAPSGKGQQGRLPLLPRPQFRRPWTAPNTLTKTFDLGSWCYKSVQLCSCMRHQFDVFASKSYLLGAKYFHTFSSEALVFSNC
jgi:hypothetical protein